MINQREIVLLSVPFSELKEAKIRPGVVVSNDSYNKKFQDMIVVPMTTNLDLREHSILVTNRDLDSGNLIKDSKIKVDRIFSVNQKLVRMKIGKVKKEIHQKINEMIKELIS